MTPLIEIKSVPIEVEMKISNASLKYKRGSADLEITHSDHGMSIRTKPIRLNIDTFEARSSLRPTTIQAVEQAADQGRQAVYEATASYAQQGKLLLSAKIGQDVIGQMAADAATKDAKNNVGIDFIPSTGPELTWDPAELNIRFEMDKLNFDWRINQPEFEFIPGNIELSVTQRPDVIITYVGGPIYVPASADPNYVPVDTLA